MYKRQKEKVSVEVESKTPSSKTSSAPVPKAERNASIPQDRKFWVEVEPKYKKKVGNKVYSSGISFSTRTLGKNFRILLKSAQDVDKVVKIYNLKRAKQKDKPVSASMVSGKYEKGGKILSQKFVRNKESLTSKAKRMGLINKSQKLSESDLNKIEKEGTKWKKIVDSVRKSKS